MPVAEVLAILLAGVAAGTINTIVGSGTLITFPTLLFFGYPPLVANMSNNIGLLPGGVSGAYGYRRELNGQAAVLRRLLPMSLLGGVTGAGLLLWLPARVFDTIVPALIGLGLALVFFGPGMQRRAAAHHDAVAHDAVPLKGSRRLLLPAGIFLAGIYGGYFGAAQGVILVGLMSVLMAETLQVINAVKNILGLAVNAVAAVVFVAARGGQIDWAVAALIGLGSLAGGVIGARVGRRLPPGRLRAVIIIVGSVAILRLTVLR
ncbi:MAG TPA: sulfite exporter TauE/SafE family protein [Dermatophilaceae bacterium]|nr:sulfite exporter TauE/SafE family protein [Dermatophilaceae bacterium]